MKRAGCSGTWGLSNNSDIRDAASRQSRGGGGTAFKRVAVFEVREAMLSSLRDDEKFGLLAMHLISVHKVQDSTRVKYGRCGRVKSITIGDVEYQEEKGIIQKFEVSQN